MNLNPLFSLFVGLTLFAEPRGNNVCAQTTSEVTNQDKETTRELMNKSGGIGGNISRA